MKRSFSVALILILFLNFIPTALANTDDELTTEEFLSQLIDLNQLYGVESFGGINGSLEGELSDVPLNRIIVKTTDNNQIYNDCGAVAKIETYNNLHVMQYSNPVEAEDAYNYFNGLSNVEYAEYDFCFSGLEPVTEYIEYEYSSKSNFSWGADAVHSDDAVSYASYLGEGAPEVIVAVIDTGVDMDNKYLKDRIAENGVDLLENDKNPDDDQGHGTMIAGIIVDNTASNVKVRPYKTIYKNGYGTYLTTCTAIVLATQEEADVINLSLGWEKENERMFDMFKDSINYAVNNGTVIVVASGNDTIDASNLCPASNDNVITVSATGIDNIPAQYSNFGECVDISAPGDLIVSTYIDSTLECDSGTSYAAPFVAAYVAFLKTLNRNYSHEDIEEIIKSTAFVPKGWNDNYGSGILDFSKFMDKYVSVQPKIVLDENNKALILSECENVVFYYTTAGAKPIVGVSSIYNGPIDITEADCIRAIACEEGKFPSVPSFFRINWKEDLKIRYKETLFLRTPPNKVVRECYSSDRNIVSADFSGIIEGVSVGEARVVAILDSGQTVTYNVTVQYAWWQMFIRIFLLGFLWY